MSLKVNPCRYCALHEEYKGRCEPSYQERCKKCENLFKHREYLKSQRKFEVGEPITDLDELLSQTWVMLYDRVKHIKVIKNFQLATIEKFLSSGAFRKAIVKAEK